MQDLKKDLRLALVQLEPVLFDKAACLGNTLKKLAEAAENGAEFIVFPELSIPGYPFGMTFGFKIGSRSEAGRKDWKRYYDASVVVPGPETDAIAKAAQKYQVYIGIGISERDAVTGTLYNTNLIFSPEGRLVSHHRKLKPTGAERLVWGDAHEKYFPMADTPWGPAGCMICWESYMPLAREALYEHGVTLYISANTNDVPEWQHTIQHIALEGRCFVINSDLFFTKHSYPSDLEAKEELAQLPEIVCRGGSCVIDPFGHYLTEPVWDKETIIYADLDMDQVAASRMEFDPCGHYARPDVLKFEASKA